MGKTPKPESNHFFESPVRSPSLPLVVAHRGARVEAPENTVSAFDAALGHGVDGIEFDVQLTRDSVPVIFHDATVRKIVGGRNGRRIGDFTVEELSRMNWGGWFARGFERERIPRLTELLQRYRGRTNLYVEIKSFPRERRTGRVSDLARAVVDCLGTAGDSGAGIFILSFDWAVLEQVRETNPAWPRVLNLLAPEDFSGYPTDGSVPLLPGLTAVCLQVGKITPDFVRFVHGRGLQVYTYACNTARQTGRALDAGVDVIMTDDPGWLVSYLKTS